MPKQQIQKQQVLQSRDKQSYRKQGQIFEAFRQYFKTFNLQFCSIDQLHDGRLLAQFLLNIENFPLREADIIQETKQIYGASVKNLKIIVSSIVKFQIENLKNQKFTLTFDFFKFYNDDDKYRSFIMHSLLTQSLRVAIQGQNSEFFIRKVMSLTQRSQTVFLNLIKNFIKSISSTPNTTPDSTPLVTPKLNKQNLKSSRSVIKNAKQHSQKQNSVSSYGQINSSRRVNKKQEEYAQYYEQQLSKVMAQNQQLLQKVENYEVQVENLRKQNRGLNALITQLEEKIYNLSKQHCHEQQNFFETMNQKITSINMQNREMIELHQKQKENLKNLYQKKFEQLNNYLKAREEIYSQSKMQVQNLIRKIGQLQEKLSVQEQQIRNTNTEKKKLITKNSQLHVENMKVSKQIETCRCKIQELSLIINLKNTEKEDQQMLSKVSSPLRLQMQIHDKSRQRSNQKQIMSNNQTEKYENSAKENLKTVQIELLQNLKFYKSKIEQQNKQIVALGKNKSRIKILQHQKKKLIGLLKEYQQYRGEQNQILMGCILQFSASHSNPTKDLTAKKKQNTSFEINEKND